MVKRIYKVTRRLGHNYDDKTPEIRIGGKWLSKAGINVGDRVELTVDEKLILISPVKENQQGINDTETMVSNELNKSMSPGMSLSDIVKSFAANAANSG